MTRPDLGKHSSPDITNPQRRQMLAAAAVLGTAPWLLIALGDTAAQTAIPPPSGQKRKLGSLDVFPMGLGCQWKRGPSDAVAQHYFGTPIDRAAAVALIRSAVDQGVTLIDTGEVYGLFVSEQIVGEALQGMRNRVVLETKFGFNVDPATGKLGKGLNSRPKQIKRAVEGSLRRLRTDRIDLLYQHRVDPQVPIEDVAGAVKDLVTEGKVLHFGLSEPGIETIKRAHTEIPLAAIQNDCARCRPRTNPISAKRRGLPMLILYGDELDTRINLPTRVWQERATECEALVDRLKAKGGNARITILSKDLGIEGNSHMMMMDKNNLDIADLIIDWMDKEVER